MEQCKATGRDRSAPAATRPGQISATTRPDAEARQADFLLPIAANRNFVNYEVNGNSNHYLQLIFLVNEQTIIAGVSLISLFLGSDENLQLRGLVAYPTPTSTGRRCNS